MVLHINADWKGVLFSCHKHMNIQVHTHTCVHTLPPVSVKIPCEEADSENANQSPKSPTPHPETPRPLLIQSSFLQPARELPLVGLATTL